MVFIGVFLICLVTSCLAGYLMYKEEFFLSLLIILAGGLANYNFIYAVL